MMALGTAAIVVTSLLIGANPPPHRVGEVTVVLIRAIVTALPDASPKLENGLEEIVLPHCSFTYLMGQRNELWYYAPTYDTAISTVVILRYVGNDSYSNGGDDQLVYFLHPGEDANVSAAPLAGMVLYSVKAEGPPWVQHRASTEDDGGNITVTYRVNGTSHPFGGYHQGALRVNETHRVEVHRSIPVILLDRHPCM